MIATEAIPATVDAWTPPCGRTLFMCFPSYVNGRENDGPSSEALTLPWALAVICGDGRGVVVLVGAIRGTCLDDLDVNPMIAST
jgi:hypothetical protein